MPYSTAWPNRLAGPDPRGGSVKTWRPCTRSDWIRPFRTPLDGSCTVASGCKEHPCPLCSARVRNRRDRESSPLLPHPAQEKLLMVTVCGGVRLEPLPGRVGLAWRCRLRQHSAPESVGAASAPVTAPKRKSCSHEDSWQLSQPGPAGILFVPDGYSGERLAAVVIGHSWCGVKEQTASIYAERLSREGIAARVFDAAYQGEGEGLPRGLEDPFQRGEDIRAAVLTSPPAATSTPSGSAVITDMRGNLASHDRASLASILLQVAAGLGTPSTTARAPGLRLDGRDQGPFGC